MEMLPASHSKNYYENTISMARKSFGTPNQGVFTGNKL